MLGAGGVGAIGARLEGAVLVRVAAGEHQGVLGADVDMPGEGAASGHMAEDQRALRERVAKQYRETGAADRQAAPADRRHPGELPSHAGGKRKAGEERIVWALVRRHGRDGRTQAFPEPAGQGFRAEAGEQGATRSAELRDRAPAGGAALEVPLDQQPVGEVGLAGDDGEQQLFRGVHFSAPPFDAPVRTAGSSDRSGSGT